MCNFLKLLESNKDKMAKYLIIHDLCNDLEAFWLYFDVVLSMLPVIIKLKVLPRELIPYTHSE